MQFRGRYIFSLPKLILLFYCLTGHPFSVGISIDAKFSNKQEKDISILLDEAGEKLQDSVTIAVKMANKAFELAKTNNQLSYQAEALGIMAKGYEYANDYNKALGYYVKAHDIHLLAGDSSKVAESRFNSALMNYYTGRYKKALEHYYDALTYYKRVNNENEIARVYQNIGMVYYDLGQTDKTLQFYKHALSINKKLNHEINIAGLYLNIGLVYYSQQDYDESTEYMKKSRKLFLDLEDKEGLATVSSNLGLIYETREKFWKALPYYQEAYKIFDDINYQRGVAYTLFNLGSIHQNLDHVHMALSYYKRSLKVTKEVGIRENEMDIYEKLAEFYEQLGNFEEALHYNKRFNVLKDSMFNSENQERINEMQAKFDLALREEELSRKNAELKYRNVIIIGLSIGLFVFVIMIIVVAITNRRRRKMQSELETHKIKLEELLEKQSAELRLEISERRIAEESDRLKSAFLANMSHEIRTPMNAIIAFSNFLKEQELTHEQRIEYIQYINTCGSNLLQIIDDIIDTAKIEARQLKINKSQTNVNKILIELQNLYNVTKTTKGRSNIEIRLHEENKKNHALIHTDPVRLRQVLTNLLDNAVKYTTEGFVEFGFENKYNSFLQFHVRDTGSGIPEDKQQLIFERFGRVEENAAKSFGGTGLGLNISKNLVELMGGRIWLESLEGVGTTFYFTIPYNHIEVLKENHMLFTAKEKKPRKYDYHWKDKTILVAEDEELNFKVIETGLKRTNVNIIRAKDGKQAIELCQAYNNLNLILMDIQMPEMDGYEATRIIKSFRPDLPIIAQTAYALTGEKEKCIDAGCDDYLAKPLILDDLLSKMSRFLT